MNDTPMLRCRQAQVTRVGFDHRIDEFEANFRDLPPYQSHLGWWIARYSRGDPMPALRDDYAEVIAWVQRSGEAGRERYGAGARLFYAGATGLGVFRDGLVLLSIALCLGRADCAEEILAWCERGDPLIERLAAACGAVAVASQAPAYPRAFDGLYAALAAPTAAAAGAEVAAYLPLWCEPRMQGMGFKVSDQDIGYWCFEAAGVVAALGLDDAAWRSHVHYPADLVAAGAR